MSETFNCGFARVAVRESVFSKDGKVEYDIDKRIYHFQSIFEGRTHINFSVSKEQYVYASKKILATFNKWKGPNRKIYEEHFSSLKWQALPAIQKGQHSTSDCRGCHVHHHIMQSMFHTKINKASKITNILDKSRQVAKSLTKVKPKVNPTQGDINDGFKGVTDLLTESFKNIYGLSFNEAAAKYPEIKKQLKMSDADKKKRSRESKRKEKENIESKWASRDCDTVLSTRQSLSQRQKQRLMLHFETNSEAQERTAKRKCEEELANVKKKRHSPEPMKI